CHDATSLAPVVSKNEGLMKLKQEVASLLEVPEGENINAIIPLNKQLYTFNYVCVTSEAATLVFSFCYIMVHIWNLIEWIGKNAMFEYVMKSVGIFVGFINGWYYDDPHTSQYTGLEVLEQMWASSQGHSQNQYSILLMSIHSGTTMDQVPDKHREKIVK
ncbi:hypothetical protein Tco_1463040, partial [Tanacetum coccineum]